MRPLATIVILCAFTFVFAVQGLALAQAPQPAPETETEAAPAPAPPGEGGGQSQILALPIGPNGPGMAPQTAAAGTGGVNVYFGASFCLGGTKVVSEQILSESGQPVALQSGPPANSWVIHVYHDENGNGALDQGEYEDGSVRYRTDRDGHWSSCAVEDEGTRYEKFSQLPINWGQVIVAEAKQTDWRETFPTGNARDLIPQDFSPPMPSNAISSGSILAAALIMRNEKLAPNGYVVNLAQLREIAPNLSLDQSRILNTDLLQDLSFENQKTGGLEEDPEKRSLCPGGHKDQHRVIWWNNNSVVVTTDFVRYIGDWEIYIYADENKNGKLDPDEYRHGADKFSTQLRRGQNGWGCLGGSLETARINALLEGSEQVIVVEAKKHNWFQASPTSHERSIFPRWLERKLGQDLIVSKKVVPDDLRFGLNNQGDVLEIAPFGYVIKWQELSSSLTDSDLTDEEYAELRRIVRDRLVFGNADVTPPPPTFKIEGYKTEPGFPGNGLKDFTIYAYVDLNGNGKLSRDEYLEGPAARTVTDVNGWFELGLLSTNAYVIVEGKHPDYVQRAPLTHVLERPPLKLEWNKFREAIRLENNGWSLGVGVGVNLLLPPLTFVNEKAAPIPPPPLPCDTCVPEFCPAPEEVRDNVDAMDAIWGLAGRPRPPRRDRVLSPYTYRYKYYEFKEAWMKTASKHIDQFVAAEVLFYEPINSPDPLPDRAEIDCRYSTTLDDGNGGKLIVTVEPKPVTDKSFIVESLQIVSDPPWSKYYDNTEFNVYECDHRHDSCAF